MGGSVFGPTVTFRDAEGSDPVCVMSSVMWNQFSYFRAIMHDATNADEAVCNVDVTMPTDFHDWLFFVAGNLHEGIKRDEVDYALNVRESCTSFGLIPHTRIDGRLQHLLRCTAHRFATTIMSWDMRVGDFSTLMARNMMLREKCVELFLDANQDPRCHVDDLSGAKAK